MANKTSTPDSILKIGQPSMEFPLEPNISIGPGGTIVNNQQPARDPIPGEGVFDFNTGQWLVQPAQPTIDSNPNPASLKGTMDSNPGSVQTASDSSSIEPAVLPPSTSQPSTPPQNTPQQFSNYLDIMRTKLQETNSLADVRQKLMTALYDRPLTQDEANSLPPNIQKAIMSGDKRDIEFQIRLLNDQIKGRTNTLDSSVSFLANEYDNQQNQLESQKQQALNNVYQFVQQYGSNAKQAISALYGDNYVQSLKKYGIDLDNLSTLPKTLQEIKDQGNLSGGFTVSIPQDIGNQTNQLAFRNNNPGNLRYAKQPGATLGAGGFAKFATPEDGFNALINQIKLDQSRNLTVSQFVSKYAPPSENDTATYIKQFTDALGVPANTKISDLDPQDIASFMAQKESGTTVNAVKPDYANIGDAIIAGLQPPPTSTQLRTSGNKALANYLAQKGFDATKAALEYKAATQYVTQLNSQRMIQYRGLATSVVNTIDEVKDLATQVKNSGVVPWNTAKLKLLVQTQGNTPAGQLASKYLAAVNTLKEEFANLANGGYAPTEAAWKLANDQINGAYGTDQFLATLGEVQRLINYRTQAIGAGGPELGIYGGGSSSGGSGTTANGVNYTIEP